MSRRFTKKVRELAGAEGRVLAKVVLDVNRAIPEAGAESRKALGGLGAVEFEGAITPAKARAIWEILKTGDDGADDRPV